MSATNHKKSILKAFVSLSILLIAGLQIYSQPLTGTFTINPVGGTYTTFSAAANALATQGVSGPVIINVASGTYNEQVTIGAIPGTSAVNTVTIQSASSDSSMVVITYLSTVSTINWTLKIDGTDFINLKDITIAATGTTYARCLEINSNATNVNISNCRFIGYNTTTTYDQYALIYSYQDPTDNITIQNNQFSNGSIGVFMQGVSNTSLSTGTKILNNIFKDQNDYGVNLYGQNAPKVNNNRITTLNTAATGIRMQYCDNAYEVENNTIILPTGNYGIDIYYCDGTDLDNGLVINNFISIPAGTTAGGIYITTSTYQKIYHNSVNINAVTSNDVGAFYLTGGSNIDVRNNIFANFGGNYAYNIKTPAALLFSDYNDYYTTGDYIGFWTSAVENLSDLKTANSKDANSVSFNPVFVSPTDAHATSFRIDNLGTNLGVTTDIDGQARLNNDIGADEFTGTGSAIAGGTYTIGATASDYTSFSLAVAALNKYGISGPVTFNVKDGSYNEQIIISPIAGADVNNPVVFQSFSNDSLKVELTFNSAIGNNFLVRFDGADFVTFRKMSFSTLNNSYARIFWFEGNANNNTVSNCILNSDITGTSSDGVFYSYGSNIGNIQIKNNSISGGRNAAYLNSNSASVYLKGTRIINNIISGQKGYTNDVVYLRYNDAPEVRDNIITNTSSTDFWGIFLQNCTNDLKITGNRISSTASNGGIQLYTCQGINSKRGLIANNFVDIGGTSYAYGIYTYDADFQNVFNNSVRITSSHTTYGRAYYNNSTSSNVTLKNNIFANLGDGYASYTDGTGLPTTFTANYNDYYSTGNALAYWNGTNQPDLTAYKTALVSQDVNSISVNPSFVSSSDLHSTSAFLDGAGIVLTEITADIDGEIRNGATPDIGADEFSTVISALAGGSYTIGGNAHDYPSFTAAVNDLNTRGIAGPVVFNVRDGLYEEQLTILDINGENSTNTITFQSESGDSSLVELSYAANLNNKFVIQLVGTDNISFKKMTLSSTDATYAMVFYLRGGIQKLNIENCSINGFKGYGSDTNGAAMYSSNAIISDLTVKNCLITGGTSGMYLESPSTTSSTNTVITNNQFSGQYYTGIFLKYHNAPRVEYNLFSSETSGSFYGIYLQYCANDFQVLKNRMNIAASSGGVYIFYCSGNATKKGLVANNFIIIGGTSNAYGIYTYGSDFTRVYNNTVKITSTSANYGYAYYNSGGTSLDIKNNIFSNFGGGYAYYTSSLTGIQYSDYNDIFTTGNFAGYWGGNYSDLAAFKAASGLDVNSVSVNPVFVSATDIHTTSYYLDNKATHIAVVTTDIDGESRNGTTPDIGADEFVASFLPMSGIYTIGGTTPDFETFSLAADALNNKGISGPVTFNVRNGSYTENFELFEISGASATNTITFQAETGDSTMVILSNNSPSALENYVIKLTGTDYITIRNMTIVGTNSTYSNIIVLNGNVNHPVIENNIISINSSSSGYGIYAPDNNNTSDVLIKNNQIIEGGYGIYLDGNYSTLSQNLEISGNTLVNQSQYGINLVDQDGPVIKGNTITSGDYSFYGIYISNCDNKITVSANKISTSNYSFGIYLYYCSSTYISQGLVSNNFVSVKNNTNAYGIYLSNSIYQNIYFNSVNIASTYSDIYPYNKVSFYITGGSNVNLKNNIFANTLGGYPYYINTPAAVTESDYNDYYSTTDIAYWGGAARTNLAVLKTANSMDAHSISINPLYISDTDLRITQTQLSKAAIPVAQVTTDIFGNPRDLSLPDIGATEFYCATPVFNVLASSTCLNDSTLFTDNSTGIAYGSTYSYDFNADFQADTTFTYGGSTLKYLFTSAGSNTVNFIVSQLGGCVNLYPVGVNVNPTPLLEVLTSGALCNANNGSASVNVTQASEPYSYLWSNGSTNATASNLGLGKYSVSVKGSNNCVGSQTFEIENALKIIVTQLKPSTCAGTDGKAMATVTGGTGPYSYVWSNGETNDTSFNLPTGAQFVNVNDANGCSSMGAINIANDGSGPVIKLNSALSNKCFGEKTGSVDVLITGGTLPYNIQWSNGSVNEDITGLQAGVYDIRVNDNSGCIASASYNIDEPALLSVTPKVTPASCNGNNGEAFAFVSGGTQPYKYEWTGGKTSSINQNLSAGVYSLSVSDNNLCTVTIPVLVNNTGGPAVTFKTVKGTSCSSANTGAVDINIAGGVFPYSYLWSPGGEISQDITSLTIGTYEVKVTDNVGCVGVNSVVIKQDPPAVNPICMVTVDSVTERNLVVWEKGNTTDVAAYNIYRESSSKEIFQLIATIPVTEESQYLDSIADPSVRAWKYKLSVVDVCGQESDLSPTHKTIHLTQNLGRNGTVNLIWDSYEGFAVNTYNILRYSQTLGWETLSSMASDQFSYTDKNPPTDQELAYVIEVPHPGGGCSTLKASNYNSARSNRQASSVKSTIGVKPFYSMNSLSIYPNPASDILNLRINQNNLKQVRVDIIDVKGQVILNNKYPSFGNQFNTNIDISRIPKGIYILRIGSDGNVNYRKLVVD
jgi:parallel beta-helix repeat protein